MSFTLRSEHVSKRFRIGQSAHGYRTLRESLAGVAAGALRRLAGRAAQPASEFWALKDVEFEVRRGEVVGIIGRNGAGKSTLLKILSRITRPTEGQVRLRGRIASLLEVGTGFHPELSGRENIYLSGSVLGMSRGEINRKFDAIVAFAEVAKFLDTPVKRYSSGMYVRLAFAVAAHLEPEILLVDEVLAVGDASFQKKCLNKMEDVGHGGRTVLFVSHNMAAVTRLCPRTVLLEAGRVVADGPSHRVTGSYLRSGLGTTAWREWPSTADAPGNEIVRLRSARVLSDAGEVAESVDIRRPVHLEIEFEVLEPGHVLVPNLPCHNQDGVYVCHLFDSDPAWKRRPRPCGTYVSTATIPGNLLAEGTMVVGVAISTFNPATVHVHERDAVAFQVVDSLDGDSARGDYAGPLPGVVRPLLHWTTRSHTTAR